MKTTLNLLPLGPASEPEPPAAAETLKNAPTYACPLQAVSVIQPLRGLPFSVAISSKQIATHVHTME